jgi:GTP-binding protein HflX
MSHERSLHLYQTTLPATESAILVGLVTPGVSRWDVEDSLDELEQLADTAGARVTDRVTQSLSQINAATYIGKGKVHELKQLVAARQSDLVIFDDDLAPVQIRNLERSLGCKLLDRSGLILDIFARRAKTAVAKTQVELAQLDYLRTRLTRQWTHLSRQKGGIGTKGPGETQIETDRRLIGSRIATLQERLDKIDRQRVTQRKGRQRYMRVSLVGYTNAGKSTLMNALAGADVLAEDRLFATLDATTRLVALDDNKAILISDTVGFIRKLPHKLIESFKSTLDEVRESDVLVHVVDATHPRFEDHIQVVRDTLKELGALQKPTLVVFNKVDALEEHGLLNALRAEFPDAAFISALRGIGLEGFKQKLLEVVEQDFVERVTYLPVTEARTIAYIHQVAEVLAEDYLYARDGDAKPLAVARLHFRVAPDHDKNLQPLIERFAELRPIPETAQGAAEDM